LEDGINGTSVADLLELDNCFCCEEFAFLRIIIGSGVDPPDVEGIEYCVGEDATDDTDVPDGDDIFDADAPGVSE
tara:strand:+ start:330 stop:554 length:225 start_codon:yes stop_codon:yes gene_type:complete